jgi:hypothetical protein
MKSASKHFEKRNIRNVGILLFEMPMFSFFTFYHDTQLVPTGYYGNIFKNKIEIIWFFMLGKCPQA